MSNPLDKDPELKRLLKDLNEIEDGAEFQRWRLDFLEKYESYLDESGVDTGVNAYTNFKGDLTKFTKTILNLEAFVSNGDITAEKVSVKARQCISELQKETERVVEELTSLCPGSKDQEKQVGYSKFIMGAILVRDGFSAYGRLDAADKVLQKLSQGSLGDAADRQVMQQIDRYGVKLKQFCDIMSDLGLFTLMQKSQQFKDIEAEPPLTLSMNRSTPYAQVSGQKEDLRAPIKEPKEPREQWMFTVTEPAAPVAEDRSTPYSMKNSSIEKIERPARAQSVPPQRPSQPTKHAPLQDEDSSDSPVSQYSLDSSSASEDSSKGKVVEIPPEQKRRGWFQRSNKPKPKKDKPQPTERAQSAPPRRSQSESNMAQNLPPKQSPKKEKKGWFGNFNKKKDEEFLEDQVVRVLEPSPKKQETLASVPLPPPSQHISNREIAAAGDSEPEPTSEHMSDPEDPDIEEIEPDQAQSMPPPPAEEENHFEENPFPPPVPPEEAADDQSEESIDQHANEEEEDDDDEIMYTAAVVEKAGGPIVLEQRVVPIPGPGEVLIRVIACGVCHADSYTQTGSFPGVEFPRVPGHEVTGQVVTRGPDVEWPQEDAIVGIGWHGGHCLTCKVCRSGNFSMCKNIKITGVHRDGGWQEYFLAHWTSIIELPKRFDAVRDAPLIGAVVAIFKALHKQTDARAGDIVAIQGIGGIGHIGIQLARKMGYRVVAISTDGSKEKMALKLGAHIFIDSEAKSVTKRLQKLGGAKLIISTVPTTHVLGALVPGLGLNGQLVTIGLDMGGFPKFGVGPNQLIFNQGHIMGVTPGTPFEAEEACEFAILQDVECITEIYTLEQAQEAYDRM